MKKEIAILVVAITLTGCAGSPYRNMQEAKSYESRCLQAGGDALYCMEAGRQAKMQASQQMQNAIQIGADSMPGQPFPATQPEMRLKTTCTQINNIVTCN